MPARLCPLLGDVLQPQLLVLLYQAGLALSLRLLSALAPLAASWLLASRPGNNTSPSHDQHTATANHRAKPKAASPCLAHYKPLHERWILIHSDDQPRRLQANVSSSTMMQTEHRPPARCHDAHGIACLASVFSETWLCTPAEHMPSEILS